MDLYSTNTLYLAGTAAAFGLITVGGVRVWNHFWPQKKDTSEPAYDDSCPTFAQIPVQSVIVHPEATWPRKNDAVPALGLREIFLANAEIIHKICDASGLNEDQCERYLLPVIQNLIKTVHLLPASQDDHHQGYGGLLTHSLEVALSCGNEANNTVFEMGTAPQERHWNNKRWVLTCILAGLVHDFGKAYTDMNVVAKKLQGADGKVVTVSANDALSWDKSSRLLVWLRKKHVYSYQVAFNPNRKHNEHQGVAAERMRVLIIPQATFNFLGSTGIGEQLQSQLRHALNGDKECKVGQILIKADGDSRKRDKANRQVNPEYKNVGNPQGDRLLKAMRSLISNNVWTTNADADSQVFNTKQGCFIVWTQDTATQIFNQASAKGFNGLPSDYLKMAEILVDSRVASPNVNDFTDIYTTLWNVTPIVLGKGYLPCLKMQSPNFLFDTVAPAEIEAVIEGKQPDEITQKAWKDKWNFVPLAVLSAEEAMERGINDEFLAAEQSTHEERASAEAEQLEAQRLAEDAAFAALNDMDIPVPPERQAETAPENQPAASVEEKKAAKHANRESGVDVPIPESEQSGVKRPPKKTPAEVMAERVASLHLDPTKKRFSDNFKATPSIILPDTPKASQKPKKGPSQGIDLSAFMPEPDKPAEKTTETETQAPKNELLSMPTDPAPFTTDEDKLAPVAEETACAMPTIDSTESDLVSSLMPDTVDAKAEALAAANDFMAGLFPEDISNAPAPASEPATDPVPDSPPQTVSTKTEEGDAMSASQNADTDLEALFPEINDGAPELDAKPTPVSDPVTVVEPSPVVKPSPTVKGKPKASNVRNKKLAAWKEVAEALNEEVLQNLQAGKGRLIPNGVTEEFGTRWADLSEVKKAAARQGIDITILSTYAQTRTTGLRVQYDLKKNRVYLAC